MPPSKADAELDARVEAAIERLNARHERTSEPEPTVERFNVVSDLTGAVVCPRLESRAVAEREASRLNAEAAKVIGPAGEDRGKTLHAGEHLGKVTTYSVRPVEVVDGDAARARNIKRLERAIDDSAGDDDARKRYERELADFRGEVNDGE